MCLQDSTFLDVGTLRWQPMQDQRNTRSGLYQATPLIHDDSIRILRIAKTEKTTTPVRLVCELFTRRLNDTSTCFEALSYTWDHNDEKSQLPVLVNGNVIYVRHNLGTFLFQLASDKSSRDIWTDAVCVDQINELEKTHQVQMMHRIYSQADCTRIWLSDEMPIITVLMHGANLPNSELRESINKRGSSVSEALNALFEHRYWSRTWILQEIILAKKIFVHCGTASLEWASFIKLCKRMRLLSGSKDIQVFGESTLMQLHQQRSGSELRDLPSLLQKYGRSECMDLRDRIFGMIGLISAPQDPLMTHQMTDRLPAKHAQIVDYSLTREDLCMRLLHMYDMYPLSFAYLLLESLALNSGDRGAKDVHDRARIRLYKRPPTYSGGIGRSRYGFWYGFMEDQPQPQVYRSEVDDAGDCSSMMLADSDMFTFSNPSASPHGKLSRIALFAKSTSVTPSDGASLKITGCAVQTGSFGQERSFYRRQCRVLRGLHVCQLRGEEDIWFALASISDLRALCTIISRK